MYKENVGYQDTPKCIYTRLEAERVLSSTDVQLFRGDPRMLPIAGLRGFSSNGREMTVSDIPYEVIDPDYVPIVLFDLDEVVWRHIQTVVRAVGEVIGKPITMEEFGKIGNTRRVPGWNDSEGTRVQDAIVGGVDLVYYPYVNAAYPGAVAALIAQERMGHRFAYLTGRPSTVIPATLRVLEWNGLPVDLNQKEYVDALSHPEPLQGWVYGADGMPMLVGRKEHKYEVVKHWLDSLRTNGWKGQLVVLDDLPKSYGTLLEEGEIAVVSLTGDVNRSRAPLPNEQRVDTWEEIHHILMRVHEQAVASDPSPYRIFNYQNSILVVAKDVSGNGEFKLENLPLGTYEWMNAYDAERAFEHLSR